MRHLGITTLLSALLTIAALAGCDRMTRERAAVIRAEPAARSAHAAAYAGDLDTCALCHAAPGATRAARVHLSLLGEGGSR